ncbi:MAG: atzF [Betaproteobacteria bacterium]|nr:atzF [Betaproteobacteria bacterium]
MSISYPLTLREIRQRLHDGSLTPIQVARDVLAAAAQGDAHHAWIYRLTDDAVLAQARRLESLPDGRKLPLYGVPFAIKDNIDVAGLPTTAACPAFKYTATTTATAVQRLLDAGAMLIGKTNLDQFATGLVGTRSPYGAGANAFNPDYISGGSSSGSALVVALNLVSFALGTDTAGSGRVPAGLNNIVGLKPTRGAISTAGVVPACRTLDCVSIFALTAGDAWDIYKVARGPDPADVYSRPLMPSHHLRAAPLRCGVPGRSQLEFCGDAEAAAMFERGVSLAQENGADIIEIDFTPFRETAALLYQGPWIAERLAGIEDFFAGHSQDLHPVTREITAAGARYSAVDTFKATYKLQALKQRVNAELARIDALLVPTSPSIYTIAQVEADPIVLNSNLGAYTNFVNLLDLAAIAVPAGMRKDGLPSGITLIAPAFSEPLLCEFGDRLHSAAGVPLGATRFAKPAPTAAIRDTADSTVRVAVVGAHLSGMPLNHQMIEHGASLLKVTRTLPRYRLYLLPDTSPAKPGLIASGDQPGHAIDIEIWNMPVERYGQFVAAIPAPLGIGTIELEDGSSAQGFVCTQPLPPAARDISTFGGWRNFIASRNN